MHTTIYLQGDFIVHIMTTLYVVMYNTFIAVLLIIRVSSLSPSSLSELLTSKQPPGK